MPNLKNSVALLYSALSLTACQAAPVFELKNIPDAALQQDYKQYFISVNADRIQQECMFFDAEAENKWRHQYFAYVLTDKNEVLPIMYAINQTGETCQKQVAKIRAILKHETQVKICANGDLEKIKQKQEDTPPINFGQFGHHAVVYEPLFLDSVCNSKHCFSYNDRPVCSDPMIKSN